MTYTPKDSEHSDTSNTIVRPISLLWPFIVGSLFLLLVLGIVAFGDDPSPMQYTIYITLPIKIWLTRKRACPQFGHSKETAVSYQN